MRIKSNRNSFIFLLFVPLLMSGIVACDSELSRRGNSKVEHQDVRAKIESLINLNKEEDATAEVEEGLASSPAPVEFAETATTETNEKTQNKDNKDDSTAGPEKSKKQQEANTEYSEDYFDVIHALLTEESTQIFWAEGPNKGMGAINSLLAIGDLALLGIPVNHVSQVSEISIFLLDGALNGRRQISLLIAGFHLLDSKPKEFKVVLTSVGHEQVEDHMTINFTVNDKILQAVTRDVEGSSAKLNSRVQLKWYYRDAVDSPAVYFGKFSSLLKSK